MLHQILESSWPGFVIFSSALISDSSCVAASCITASRGMTCALGSPLLRFSATLCLFLQHRTDTIMMTVDVARKSVMPEAISATSVEDKAII